MNFESVLIITYGRSGSTLLQGLLNSIDGCVVRGENYNLCYGLCLAWRSLYNTMHHLPEGVDSMTATSPWFGAGLLNEESFFRDARALVYHQLIPESKGGQPRCVGFKEIRYLPEDFFGSDLEDYLDFLAKLFPNPAFIVLTRDHEQVAGSAWWRNEDPEQVKQRLRTFEKGAADYAKGKSFVFSLDYQDMTNRTDRLKQLFEFLGAPYVEERVERVLSMKHSYTPTGEKATPRPGEREKAHHLKIEKTACPELAYFFLEKLAGPAGVDRSVVLRGIAALRHTDQEEYRLIVKDSSGEHAVAWGLPSPVFAKKHPDIPKADFSRFKIEGLKLSSGDVAKMYLVNKQGDYQCFARIRLK